MNYMVFNIETVPDTDLDESLVPKLDDFEAPKNYKDFSKILESKKEQLDQALSKMSLTPLTGRIVCYGEIVGDSEQSEEVANVWTSPAMTEEAIVRHFMERHKGLIMSGGTLIGYNSKSFDLPFLYMKAIQYGIYDTIGFLPKLTNRYSVFPHLDVYMYLSGFETGKKGKLGDWAKRFKCANQVFGSGSMVAEWYNANDLESIRKHCESNIRATLDLAHKINIPKYDPLKEKPF